MSGSLRGRGQRKSDWRMRSRVRALPGGVGRPRICLIFARFGSKQGADAVSSLVSASAQTGATPLSARLLTMRVRGDVLPFCSLGFGGGFQVAPNHAESQVQHARGGSALDSRTGHSQRGGSRLPPLLCCQRGLRFFVGIQY